MWSGLQLVGGYTGEPLWQNSELAQALGKDWKGKLSIVIDAVAIVIAFILPALSCVLYAIVACIWLIPDRRIEKK